MRRRYVSPFDAKQALAASEQYRSFRAHLRVLREQYPPVTTDERTIIRNYRAAVEKFSGELRNELRMIRAEKLNEHAFRAEQSAVEYLLLKQLGKLR